MKDVPTPIKMLLLGAVLIAIGTATCPTRPTPPNPAELGRALLSQPEVRDGYSFLVEGTDVVAGKECLTVRLKPPHKHLPWRQLWMDRKTLQIVATRSWDGEDRVTGSSMVSTP